MSREMPRPPGRWPSRAIRLAVRALPPGRTRDRYRHEFLAELYGMSSTRQMRHAAHLLTRSLVLRAAVNRERQSSTLELSMPVLAPRKPLLCRLNVHHKWVRRLNPDREVYLQCKHCGKDLYDVERSSGPNTGGNIAGLRGGV
jgi:hypothetical protein